MADDERIARLTELARRVLVEGSDSATVAIEPFGVGMMIVHRNEERSAPMLAIDHPRCCDALEAALLVLTGEEPDDGTYAKLVKVADKLNALRAGIETLAAEWDARAAKWRDLHEHDDDECVDACNAEAKQVENCAAELRERARRGAL